MRTQQFIFGVILLACIAGCLSAVYYPFGPQTDVPESMLVGWRRCWNSSYSEQYTDNTNITFMYNQCSGEHLIYSCREDGATNLTLLAAGMRDVVLNNTGDTSEVVSPNNGVDWYFYPGKSIGFAKQGDSIDKDNCDFIPGNYPELKLCWHASGNSEDGSLYYGYRCGAATDIEGNWTREIWTYDPCASLNEGDACDDINPCTSNDTCTAGVCTGTPCDQCEECDPNSGCVPTNEGLNCTDDSLCTDNDTCQQGVCVGELITCTIPQGCFNSTCIALTGQCQDACPAPGAETPVMTPVKAPIAKASGVEKIIVFNGLMFGVVALLI